MAKKNGDLPRPTSLWQSIGPSFILLGLALGSGELLLWPYLVSQHGLGLIWGGLVGITFQYFLNTEIMRYTLARGESVFVGWRRWSPILSIWFILSSFIPWVLPGVIATSGAIVHHLIPVLPENLLTIALLILLGLILSVGKTLYKTIEAVQRTILLISIPFIAYLVFRLAGSADWSALALGLVGRGEGWWFIPEGLALGSFFGALAYSGAGGNLNLAQSYYIKEKGFGMGKYGGRVSALFAGGEKKIFLEGSLFRDTPEGRRRWASWWRLVTIEHGLVFWGLGLFTIALLATLSFVTSRAGVSGSGLTFLFHESETIGSYLHPLFGKFFLISGAVMLFATQLGIFEATGRIISENMILLSHKEGRAENPSRGFYLSLWSLIILGVLYTVSGSHEPRLMVTIGALMNAGAMMVAFPLIFLLNRTSLPRFAGPGRVRAVIFIIATLFFLVFLTLSVKSLWGGQS